MFKNLKIEHVIFWVLGLIFGNFGVALCTKANFGLNMIAAPTYIIHVWLRDRFPWYTQGTSEYIWEFIILMITCIFVRKFKLRYLLSFITAVICGFILDIYFKILGGNGAYESLYVRIIAFVMGTITSGFGVACYFRTILPLQVYELSVVEVSQGLDIGIIKIKRVFDAIMFAISIILALVLNHSLDGLGIGTIISVFANSLVIGFFDKIITKVYNRKVTDSTSKDM